MSQPVLYRENPNVVIPHKFIKDDTAYGEALEAFVLVCTDCLFINKKRQTIFLAKRKSKPLSEWWMIGGRIFAGEEEKTAMCRSLKRETGLEISPERLKFLTMKRYLFKDRQQQPQDKGCDSLCYTFGLEVTDDEIEIVKSNLDVAEYDRTLGLQEFDPDRLTAENVFPPIIDLYEEVFRGRVVERPKQKRDMEEWQVINVSCGYKVLENTTVCIAGKKNGPRQFRDRIPKDKLSQIEALMDEDGSIKTSRIYQWSQVSQILGITLHVFVEDNRFPAIHFLYSVYSDGTVENGGFTQFGGQILDRKTKQPRRSVRPDE